MKDKTLLGVVAMLNITALELFALSRGIDGMLLITVLTIIAGLAGYNVGRRLPENRLSK